jgi:hypothetical protein
MIPEKDMKKKKMKKDCTSVDCPSASLCSRAYAVTLFPKDFYV